MRILAGTDDETETLQLCLADRARTLSISKKQPSDDHGETADGCNGAKQLSDRILGLGEAKTVDRAAEEGDSGGESVACRYDRARLGQAEGVKKRQAVQKLVLRSRVPGAHL